MACNVRNKCRFPSNIVALETVLEAAEELGMKQSTIKTAISSDYRPDYIRAYQENDEATMMEIEDDLMDTGLGYTDKDFEKWITEAEQQIAVEDEDTTGAIDPGTITGSTGQLTGNMAVLEKSMYANTEGELYGRGNIDLNNRQVVYNEDGTISTEQSFSVNIDGKEVLLPTVIDGRIVSEEEAIDHYYETGEYLGKFDTVEEAEEYAEMLHNRQGWYYNR